MLFFVLCVAPDLWRIVPGSAYVPNRSDLTMYPIYCSKLNASQCHKHKFVGDICRTCATGELCACACMHAVKHIQPASPHVSHDGTSSSKLSGGCL